MPRKEYKRPKRKAVPVAHRTVKVALRLPWWIVDAIQIQAANDNRTFSNCVKDTLSKVEWIAAADPARNLDAEALCIR